MKRVTALIAALVFIVALTACSPADIGETTTEEDILITSADIDVYGAVLELVPSVQTVKAGEQFSVMLKMKDCVWFTDMILHISYPAECVSFVSGSTVLDIQGFNDAVNAAEDEILYSLMFTGQETVNGDCAEFKLSVLPSAPSGTVIELKFTPDCIYHAACDALGVNTEDITSEISLFSCSVTVE